MIGFSDFWGVLGKEGWWDGTSFSGERPLLFNNRNQAKELAEDIPNGLLVYFQMDSYGTRDPGLPLDKKLEIHNHCPMCGGAHHGKVSHALGQVDAIRKIGDEVTKVFEEVCRLKELCNEIEDEATGG